MPRPQKSLCFSTAPWWSEGHPHPLARGDQCLGGRPLPRSPEVGDKGALPSRPSSTFIYCVKALGPLSDGCCPSLVGGDLPSPLTAGQLTNHTCVLATALTWWKTHPEGLGSPTLGCESKGLYLGPLSLSWSKLAMIRVEGSPQISSLLLLRQRRGDGKIDPPHLLSLHPLLPSYWRSRPKQPSRAVTLDQSSCWQRGDPSVFPRAFSSRFHPD